MFGALVALLRIEETSSDERSVLGSVVLVDGSLCAMNLACRPVPITRGDPVNAPCSNRPPVVITELGSGRSPR